MAAAPQHLPYPLELFQCAGARLLASGRALPLPAQVWARPRALRVPLVVMPAPAARMAVDAPARAPRGQRVLAVGGRADRLLAVPLAGVGEAVVCDLRFHRQRLGAVVQRALASVKLVKTTASM
jgi:hypothetical protein